MSARRYCRVLAYARVSSEEQARGTSLGDQQQACKRDAEGRGLGVDLNFVEAESAILEKLERREKMQELMSVARSGDLILCDKIDRWSRDPEFTYRSVRELLAMGASIFFVGDNCDPSTPEGDTMLGFRILFAREEHKRIKLRMVGTRKRLRDAGYWTEGHPPPGYRRPDVPKGYRGPDKNTLVPSVDADLIRRLFQLSIDGLSTRQISEETGVPQDNVSHAIKNRIYLGEIRDSRGIWIRGQHEAIIDVVTFQKATEALSSRKAGWVPGGRTGTEATVGWILRDVAVCADCGTKMSSAYASAYKAKDPKQYAYFYYRCSQKCGAKHVRVDLVEPVAAPMILAYLLSLRAELSKGPKGPATFKRNDHADRLAKMAMRRDRYIEAFAEATITHDDLKTRLAKIDSERTSIESDMATASKPDPLRDPKSRRHLLANVEVIRSKWIHAGGNERRRIVSALAKAFRLKHGEDPIPDWKPVTDILSRDI